jgi:hypothetical protein
MHGGVGESTKEDMRYREGSGKRPEEGRNGPYNDG